MKSRTCCFTGHREINKSEVPEIRRRIKNEIISLIENDVLFFGVGGARGFDILAAEVVLELKESFPQIKLILVLPCKNQTIGWRKTDLLRYESLLKRADKVRYLSEHYYNGCMIERNKHLVDNSSVCICYYRKNSGGTAFTVNYAKQKKLLLIYI